MFLRNITFLCALLIVWNGSVRGSEPTGTISIESRKIALNGVPFSVTITVLDADGGIDDSASGEIQLYGFKMIDSEGMLLSMNRLEIENGTLTIDRVIFESNGQNELSVVFNSLSGSKNVQTLPAILSLAPPLIAIGLAVLFKEVLLSLFAGIWIGAIFLAGYNPISGFLVAIDKYIVPSLANKDHAAVILFSMGLGGMVGLIARNGGMHGVVEKISKYAKSARSGQIATLSMGLLIFFDDYANTLLVGNTMRPFTDKLKISREKLAFLVDATAAPIASIAFVSTWIGFQNGLIQKGFDSIGLDRDPYITFISSIPYSFYAFIMLGLIVITAVRARDFGPMLTAERRAQETGKVLREGANPLAGADLSELDVPDSIEKRWYNAMIPIGFVIVTTIVGLYFNGKAALGATAESMKFHEIIGSANSFTVLMWAAFGGSILAAILSLSQKLTTLQETVDGYLNGIKSMVYAMVILILAWSLGSIAADLSTAEYVLHITRGLFSPNLLPAMTFIVAALIGFSTGTSWGTMAILTPIVIPMAYHLPIEAGIDVSLQSSIFLGTIAAVLSGACFGDHCSPISDTTILSSMASGADHIDHVKTQLPYALLAAGVAIVFGYIPAGYGMNPFLSIVLGIGALYLIHRKISKPVIVS